MTIYPSPPRSVPHQTRYKARLDSVSSACPSPELEEEKKNRAKQFINKSKIACLKIGYITSQILVSGNYLDKKMNHIGESHTLSQWNKHWLIPKIIQRNSTTSLEQMGVLGKLEWPKWLDINSHLFCELNTHLGSLIAQLVKNPPAMQETRVRFLFWEDPPEKGKATHSSILGLPSGSTGKESTHNAGDLGSIPGLGRSPGQGKGYPLQYSGLENSMDCIVHRVAKSQTGLSDFNFHTCTLGSNTAFATYHLLWH